MRNYSGILKVIFKELELFLLPLLASDFTFRFVIQLRIAHCELIRLYL